MSLYPKGGGGAGLLSDAFFVLIKVDEPMTGGSFKWWGGGVL